MLVLSRKPGESVCIGDATVTVRPGKGRAVLLCIEAPKEVPVDRREVRVLKDRRLAGRGSVLTLHGLDELVQL